MNVQETRNTAISKIFYLTTNEKEWLTSELNLPNLSIFNFIIVHLHRCIKVSIPWANKHRAPNTEHLLLLLLVQSSVAWYTSSEQTANCQFSVRRILMHIRRVFIFYQLNYVWWRNNYYCSCLLSCSWRTYETKTRKYAPLMDDISLLKVEIGREELI